MNEGVHVEIRGTTQLAAGMRTLAGKVQRAARDDATRETVRVVAQQVRAQVPVKSGRLRGTVRDTMRGDTGQVTMGAGLRYGGWIEYGGSRGRPLVSSGRYLGPVAQQQEHPFHDRCEQAASREIRGMTWPTPR